MYENPRQNPGKNIQHKRLIRSRSRKRLYYIVTADHHLGKSGFFILALQKGVVRGGFGLRNKGLVAIQLVNPTTCITVVVAIITFLPFILVYTPT